MNKAVTQYVQHYFGGKTVIKRKYDVYPVDTQHCLVATPLISGAKGKPCNRYSRADEKWLFA